MKPTPLPIHFKLPGRSYNQIGRKGNVALYSVYSDYLLFADSPYVLIGFELIVIKVKDGREVYPAPWQFGKSAWSIPKSIYCACVVGFRRCVYGLAKLRVQEPKTVPNRSPASEACPSLATT